MGDSWWKRLLATGPRVSGRPTSTNGASSFHLNWGLSGPADSVSVTLEVVEPPVVDRLYFWALQADFAEEGRPGGGAHLGLQWHPSYPGRTAVNWGGYRQGGGELRGSTSPLPSALDNPNTRDYPWRAGTAYRLRIEPVDEVDVAPPVGHTAWRGSVEDLSSGRRTHVRDLYVRGDAIRSATMWSEVFARCDDPSVSIRWTDPQVRRISGESVTPPAVAVNYQSHAAGGCANTSSWPDSRGLVQRTNTERSTPQGARLPTRPST